MNAETKNSLDYEKAIPVADNIYWVGFYDELSGLHCNPYLIIDGEEAVVIDGGSRPDFPTVMMKILQTGIHPSSIIAMTYHIIDTKDLRLQYSNAAHPHPLLLRKGRAPEPLKRGGTIVGMRGILPFEDGQKALAPGDKLILHTDGITEYQNREGTLFGDDRFHELLEQMKDQPVAELVKGVYDELMSFGDG